MTKNQIDYWRLQEEKRSHAATEGETKRSNLAKEAENYRSNLARETETHRANVVSEGIAFGNLSEATRSHMANEGIAQANLEETVRHQMATESETQRSNLAKEMENYRHNSAVESETRRSNIVNEGINAGYLAEQTVYHQQQLAHDKTSESNRHKEATERNMIEWAKLNKNESPTIIVNNSRGFKGEGNTPLPTSGVDYKQWFIETGKKLLNYGVPTYLLPE